MFGLLTASDPNSSQFANYPIAGFAQFRSSLAMTKLFYGSFTICALLAFLTLMIFFSAYLRDAMVIYHDVTILTSGGSSLILLASIFFTLKARIVALLIFAVATISSYVWQVIYWQQFDPTTMSFSNGLFEELLFLAFVVVPFLGIVSGAFLLRQYANAKSKRAH